MLTRYEKETPSRLGTPATTLFTRTPFSFMRRFAEDMEHMFDNMEQFRLPVMFGREFLPFSMEMKNADWLPEVEVDQHNGEFIVRCDLPGMKKEDIKVEVKDEFLTISGERKQEKKEEREGYFRTERTYGSFFRQLPLPEGAKFETAEATFRDGVLEIKIPAMKKEPTIRRLEVKEPVTTEKPMAKAATT